MSISAEEKIRQLVELEKNKRKEIEDKKQELEKKKKEVEELEKARRREIADARQELDEEIDELVQEQKKDFEEIEEVKRKREAPSLEEKVGGGKPEEPKFKGYGDAISQVMQGRPGFYDVTNYNVMNRLEEIAGESQKRPLTKNELEFVHILEYHAKSLARDDFYKDKEGATYLKKELAKIDMINKMAKKNSEYDMNVF
jgi:hypothetical protein